MATSTIKLPNGTIITIEGSPDELNKVLSLYNSESLEKPSKEKITTKTKSNKKDVVSEEENKDYVSALVNAIKNSEDLDTMEERILNKASQIDKVILPLYITSKEFDNKFSLTSGDIYKVLKELGINMALPNVSKTLKKKAIKYVIADKMTKKGESTAYKISRKGEQYISETLGK